MTPNSPKLTVVVPVYNGAAHLEEAVASVPRATTIPYEIIIVDDGSSDATPQVVAGLAEGVRHIRQHNAGPAAARNRGVRMAEGEYVRFLDSDDLYAPDSTDLLVSLLDHKPEVDVAMGYCQGFEGRQGADGTIIATGTTAARLNFGVGTAVFRRDALNRLGGFQPVLRYGEDLDLLLRAHEAGIVIDIVSDVTLYYRIHASSSTHGKDIHELNLLTILKTSLDRRRSKVSPDVE